MHACSGIFCISYIYPKERLIGTLTLPQNIREWSAKRKRPEPKQTMEKGAGSFFPSSVLPEYILLDFLANSNTVDSWSSANPLPLTVVQRRVWLALPRVSGKHAWPIRMKRHRKKKKGKEKKRKKRRKERVTNISYPG